VISGSWSPTRLLGRDAELQTLTACLDRARGGSAAVAVLEGAAGIGKTRLVNELVARAEGRGFRCLGAACEEALGRPFGPLLDALADPGQGVPPGSGAPVTPASGPSEYRMVEELSDRLERLSSTGPLLLAVDDLQWADPSTLTVLRRAARRLALRPVTILAVVRSEHPPGVAGAVEDLLRLGAIHVRLGDLSEDAAVELVGELAGLEPGHRLVELMRGASGNPLYLVELTRSMLQKGALQDAGGVAEVVGDGLPTTFRALVVRRLRSLSQPAARAIRAGAILGLSFGSAELAAMLGCSAFELAPALEEAVRAGVLQDAGDRLGFAHALVRQVVYEELPANLRKQLHRETAAALLANGVPSERVAVHVALGADRGDRSAVRWLRQAAAQAAHRAPGTTAELLQRAREIVSPTDPDRDELLADLAMAWATTGRLREAETLANQVLQRHPGPLVAGRLRAGIVYALCWQGRPGQAVAESRTSEPDLSSGDRVLVEAEGLVAQVLTGDVAAAGPRITGVLQAAQRSGHTLARCHVLCAATRERMLNGHLLEAVSLGGEAVRLAEADPALAPAQPWFFLGLALMIADRTEESEAVVRRGREVAEDLGLVWSVPLYMSYLANVCWLTGRWDNALAEDEAGRAITEEFGMHLTVILASASRLARIWLHRGRIDRAQQALVEAEAWLASQGRQGGDALVLSARALLLEARGQLRPAAELLGRAWRQNLQAGVVSELRLLAPDLVRLCLATGRDEVAASLLPDVERIAAQLQVPSAEGAALRCRGLLARDPDVLLAAVEAYRRSPRLVELAQTCEEAAIHLAGAGRRQAANDLLQEASRIFGGVQAVRDLARLRGVARRHGLAGPPRSMRPSTGWESLTDSERRVAELVADGATNREVAAALVISTHTVDSHLRHVFAKLTISSRVQLAAIVSKQMP
jgi:DNA-binding CsgD family transcriptional regulator/tetratricopeptide (TPR) repeat protein